MIKKAETSRGGAPVTATANRSSEGICGHLESYVTEVK